MLDLIGKIKETLGIDEFGSMFKVPKCVQDVFPINEVYEDGIFSLGKDVYSKTMKFTDVNYAISSRKDKEEYFRKYSAILNSLENGMSTQITLVNRKIKNDELEQMTLSEDCNDGNDIYRSEINDMLMKLANNSTSIVQDMYITISAQKGNVKEARAYFDRAESELSTAFSDFKSYCERLDLSERLRIIRDFCKPHEVDNLDGVVSSVGDISKFKDYICPDSFEFKSDYFKVGDKFARVMYIKEYPSYIKDSIIWELTESNRNMMVNFDIVPMSTEEAKKLLEKIALGIETDIANFQRKQNSNNNYSAVIPFEMEQKRNEIREFLNDTTERDQRMFSVLMTIMHTADSLEELDNDTEALCSIGRKHMCQFATLKYQQMEGFCATLPIGVNKIQVKRTLTTESLAAFMPFKVQEIQHTNGIFQGVNVISKNMIFVDRKELLNGNCFILGVSGSGKSFTAKEEIVNLFLTRDCDIIIIDPEREYKPLIEALDGQVVKLSASSENHINCLDINANYAVEGDPVSLKTEFVLSFFEQIVGNERVSQMKKSIIDRCLKKIYAPYIEKGFEGEPPTLINLVEELKRQEEPEAREAAVQAELFATGSHNTFAKQTNVNINNRLLCYDILELGSQLMPIGMLVVLDNILNRITANRMKGRETYIFIDEIYLLFKHEYASEFLFTLWKRVRKYGAFCTGITQNVDDLLQSHTARTMLANSEFIIMLNQGGTDRDDLANLLQITEAQIRHITNVKAGHGLLKVGSNLVPFERNFPKDTELYRLMTTKVGE